MNDPAVFSMKNVSVQFGGVRAVNNLSLDLARGDFVGLIGPNGAGKTTIFNLITNSVKPTSGEILFKGKSVVGKRPDEICHLGISRTFQNIRIFPAMTVFENIAIGLHSQPTYSLLESFVRTPNAMKKEREIHQRTNELLSMMDLQPLAKERAGNLAYGLQRRLELARAMATGPELLLLDEPAAGMNEDECHDLVKLVRQIHETYHYTIILIEHHMHVVMDLCANSRIYVMALGELLTVGSPVEIQNNQSVVKVYLGERRGKK
jgi:branched-chain amino acid transport system ATP-binding protein